MLQDKVEKEQNDNFVKHALTNDEVRAAIAHHYNAVILDEEKAFKERQNNNAIRENETHKWKSRVKPFEVSPEKKTKTAADGAYFDVSSDEQDKSQSSNRSMSVDGTEIAASEYTRKSGIEKPKEPKDVKPKGP